MSSLALDRHMPVEPDLFDEVVAACGIPYFRDDSCLLFHGDVVDLLSSMPKAVVDLTVTSPPYNIGKEYEAVLPLPQYLDWCGTWMNEVHRVTRPQGAFWLNVGYVSVPAKGRAVPLPYLLWDRSPFFMVQEIVWHYGAGVAARRAFSPRNEKWVWYVEDPDSYRFDLDAVRDPDVKYPNQKKNGKIKVNPLGKNPGDVWVIPKVTSGAGRAAAERTPHPAQFPMAVVERIIRACSAPKSVILDPFVGSGTVAAVGAPLGRRVIGFDKEERYLELASKRLVSARAEVLELPLVDR